MARFYNLRIIEVVVLVLLLFLFSFTQAQQAGTTTLRGKISDNNGELLIGASVVLTAEKSKGTVTDLDGNYTLKIQGSGNTSLTISYIGYKTIEESIELKQGSVIIRDFVLTSASFTIKEAVITAKAVKTADSYMQRMKTKSTTSIDYISAATIKKTGDASVGAAVSRIVGVTTSGGLISVRGIGDRYVLTTINGSLIPTLDPFTNNIKLDIFPASLVDNIIVVKTASPDLPADWAGAFISVETKDYPEALSVNFESSFEYNPQTTFKNVISSMRSNTDWLGYDNGFRDHDHGTFVQVVADPNTYQYCVGLGLQQYYDSLGVTAATPWTDTYFKLGLVRLGLLPPALFNDATAFVDAKAIFYSESYQMKSFNNINANAARSGQSFPNNWETKARNVPMNFSQTVSIGNQFELFGKQLGFIAGFRYGNATIGDPHAHLNRATVDASGAMFRYSGITQEVSRETNGWNALISTSMKLNKNNSISLLFMPNFRGSNNVRNAYDTVDAFDKGNRIQSQNYEHRRQIVYQYKSEHYLPGSKIRLEFNGSYTNGSSEMPDFKDLTYTNVDNGLSTILTAHRYYRYLSDKLLDTRMSMEFPLSNKAGLTRKLKAGASYQQLNRSFDQYDYALYFGPSQSPSFTNDDVTEFFDLEKFGLSTYTYQGQQYPTVKEYYVESHFPSNHMLGTRRLTSGFVMIDYDIIPRLRFAGGLRTESFYLHTDATKYDALNLPENDPRRFYANEVFTVQPGALKYTDIFPSAGIIFKLKENEAAPMNIRLNFSQTVARPSVRELYDGLVFDYELRSDVFGNSKLDVTRVFNYDLRYESFFKSGDNISLSLFYKSFKNHIELVNTYQGYSWQNVDHSIVQGLEIEGRKAIVKNLEFKANVALVYSASTFVLYSLEITNGVRNYIPIDTVSRTMYGQAPYVLNGMLSYTNDSIGFSATLSYNVQGQRLAITSAVKGVPDIYELPRHVLDLKISQKFWKHFNLSFTAYDLLNSPIRRSYNYKEGWVVDYDAYQFGTSYKLSLAYKL